MKSRERPIERGRRGRRWRRTTASCYGWCLPWNGSRAGQKFLLGDRIQGAALDVLELLIEATYTRERTGHLARANVGLEKLRFLIRLAGDLRHLDRRRYEHAARCTGRDRAQARARQSMITSGAIEHEIWTMVIDIVGLMRTVGARGGDINEVR